MASVAERRPHAFLSYVREDRAAIDRIQSALEAAGIPVWRDVDSVWPGEEWKTQIREAIRRNSLAFIAFFSDASEARDVSYQREEILLAVEQLRQRASGAPWFIPVRLTDCQIPEIDVDATRTLGSFQWIDLFGDHWQRGLTRLVEGVRRLLPDSAPLSPPAPPRGAPTGEGLSDRDWTRIVAQVEVGDCVPILGLGVSRPPLPTDGELARRWADHYGLPADDRRSLAGVMQYAYVAEGDAVAVRRRFAEHLASYADPNYADPAEPHALLARSPIRTYLTTAYDDFMTRALVRQRKDPVTAICPWYAGSGIDPETTLPPHFEPQSERPLVFHLHGSLRQPFSLVLAEQDDTEFQMILGRDLGADARQVLPPQVLHALVRQPALFLGHDLGDRRFRSLLLTLLTSLSPVTRRRHLIVQPPSSEGADFLTGYAERLNLSIYWGTVQEFCRELDARLQQR